MRRPLISPHPGRRPRPPGCGCMDTLPSRALTGSPLSSRTDAEGPPALPTRCHSKAILAVGLEDRRWLPRRQIDHLRLEPPAAVAGAKTRSPRSHHRPRMPASSGGAGVLGRHSAGSARAAPLRAVSTSRNASSSIVGQTDELVSTTAPMRSGREYTSSARKPGIAPPWPARIRSPRRCSIRPRPQASNQRSAPPSPVRRASGRRTPAPAPRRRGRRETHPSARGRRWYSRAARPRATAEHELALEPRSFLVRVDQIAVRSRTLVLECGRGEPQRLEEPRRYEPPPTAGRSTARRPRQGARTRGSSSASARLAPAPARRGRGRPAAPRAADPGASPRPRRGSSRWRPEACASIRRIGRSPCAASSERAARARSSRSSLPASRSCMTAGGGERLRDRADPVLRVRRRRGLALRAGQPTAPPDDLAVSEHGGG